MKKSTKKAIDLVNHKMYGTALLGARGQLVIPAEARKDLGLEPGDRIMVMGKFNKMLGLIKSDELEDLLEAMMGHLNTKGIHEEMRKHALKELTKLKKANKGK